ncbi:transcription factor BIM2-like isoform X1 [Salvia hispanica]|uniref:transcription factor BIM2-like isoform X1 n=1 Tax=Salvia hispanica TaxID=49212 RepID=UPI00200990A7|nr:transcription factor BIM2-like isoform X1 [Salvia hispanica]
MKSGKGHQEEEEEEEEEFGAKKDATSSANNSKDGKNSDKANAIRSKHSVTEQRRRSKINERFQILRELIPHSDQKRDTASFLVEVIQYVQFLQEKVQKYEGSYQPWNSEPTKLMPWRNSHWRVQNFVGQPPTAKNGSAPGSAFPGRFDENSLGVPMTMQPGQTNPIEPDHVMDAQGRPMDLHTELPNKSMSMPLPIPVSMGNDGPFSHTFGPSEAQSSECPSTADALNLQDELTIEGGTINVSSAYSEGLLTTLTQALQSTGLDLSQASISVQINLGKRANRGATPTAKDHIIPTPSSNQPVGTFHEATSSEDFDLAQKRRKL